MVNQFDSLLQSQQLTDAQPISRAQLPLLLAKVNGVLFTQLLFEWLGIVLIEEQKRWFSLDGKELRAVRRCGNIQSGHTRGEVVVSALDHQTHQVVAQTHYAGTKESERPAVAGLIETQGLAHQKLSLDALHLIPSTLALIHGGTGQYVVGLKPNQPKSYQSCTLTDLFGIADYERVDAPEKKHGRVEQRHYRCFKLKSSLVAARWQKAGLCTLLCVVGNGGKSGVVSEELRYYVSNMVVSSKAQADELFDAIRGHCRAAVAGHRSVFALVT